tara:strand:- start:80 stop:1024 length:945 start_codon:yes stop_codon:yes gene_type:complete
MKVFITDYVNNPNIEKKILGKNLFLKKDKSIDVLLVWHQKCDNKYLSNFPNLKLIVRYGVGYENIDLSYLKKKCIRLVNNPDYGVDEVSNTALAFLLSFNRKIQTYNFNLLNSSFNSLEWQEKKINSIKRSNEFKVGVIGAGRIGSSFLLKAKNLNFDTYFYDPYLPNGYDKVLRSKKISNISDLFKICDAVSIHCPYNSQNKNLVNLNILMNVKKREFLLINTARGGIVCQNDLYKYFIINNKFNISLDVLEEEPPQDSDKLINLWKSKRSDRIIINPHTAFYSKAAYKEMRVKASILALNFIKYNKLENVIV